MTFQPPTGSPPPLSPLLADVLSPTPTLAGVRAAADLCYGLASSYLEVRSRGIALGCRLGMAIDDLAFDAVMHVFAQDGDHRRYHRLQEAFAHHAPPNCPDEQCLVTLRHMVSSFLEEKIVRRILESYPPIERIRRNLRNSVASSKLLEEVRTRDDLWVTVNGAADIDRPLPVFPPVMLERFLVPQARKSSTVAGLIPVLAHTMKGQSTFRPAIPVDALAVCIQNVYLLAGRRKLAGMGCPGEQGNADFERTVLNIVAEVETRLRRKLVDRDGVDPAFFTIYIHASADILKGSLCAEPGREMSFFEILRRHIGSIDRETYHEEHRRRLEYVVDQARGRYFERLKRR